MTRRFAPFAPVLAVMAALLPAVALHAQEAPPAAVPAAPAPPADAAPAAPAVAPLPIASSPVPAGAVMVDVQTSAGTIVIAVDKQHAPITGGNFLRYVDQKRFDGTSFYRATKVAPGYGLVQGGTSNDPKRVLKPIAHEPTTVTGLSHVDGAVSMARGRPGTATGDFFIVIGDLPSMDAAKTPGGDPGFAVFGKVVRGMDIARKILLMPTSPTRGAGVMKGQMLEPPVKILAVRRE